jgi:hypothetical protein
MTPPRTLASRVAPALAALVAAATLGACGGDGGNEEQSGPDPNEVLACAQDGGVPGLATGPDEAIGTTGGLQLEAPPKGIRIVVDFFTDPDAARTYSDGVGAFVGGAGGAGRSEVVDETVVISTAGPGAEEQTALVRGCVG